MLDHSTVATTETIREAALQPVGLGKNLLRNWEMRPFLVGFSSNITSIFLKSAQKTASISQFFDKLLASISHELEKNVPIPKSDYGLTQHVRTSRPDYGWVRPHGTPNPRRATGTVFARDDAKLPQETTLAELLGKNRRSAV